MANKNAANINNATNNTREEKTMNYTTMKKADLIALIEEKDRELRVAELKIEGLGQALKAVKATMKKFCGGMNDIFTAEIVKNATAEVKPEKVTEEQQQNNADTVKNAPKVEKAVEAEINNPEPENTEEPPKTRKNGINAWKIAKYGSEERADRVQAMTKVVAEDWRNQWIATGKRVVARSEYKAKLYEEAERRVAAEEKAEAEAKAKAATKGTQKTATKGTRGRAKKATK